MRAIRGYADRDRIHLTADQTHAEDRALEAAHADRQAGKTTIMIAQTSDEHLDELNARAQAIRHQHSRTRTRIAPAPRPAVRNTYRRRGADPPHHPPRRPAVRADLRLAYVQHPFPAQGQTTDTAHLLVGEHATREGTYVAMTRARERTHVHAAATDMSEVDRLAELSERVSRAEPDLPSIQTPLAHEHATSADLAITRIGAEDNRLSPDSCRTEARRRRTTPTRR